MTTLNQTTLENIKNIIEESPAIDLWPHLREQIRRYKKQCDKIAKTEQPNQPDPDLNPDAARRWRYFLPIEGDVKVCFPLSSELVNLGLIPASSSNIEKNAQEGQQGQLSDVESPSLLSINGNHHEADYVSRTNLYDLLEEGEWIHELWSTAVVRISPNVVVKICKADGTTELMNLVHIRAQNPNIPVPEALGMV